MTPSDELETLLAEIVLHHEQHGVLPPMEDFVARRPELGRDLVAMAYRYLAVSASLDTGAIEINGVRTGATDVAAAVSAPALPSIEGFRTIERIGTGGMGEVYKLQDLKLGRIVAAKVIRRDADGRLRAGVPEFLREAKSLALFSDPRIVRIFECRMETEPAVIIMEHVDGFELGRLGPSLEFRQRAKIIRDVCHAVHHAHTLGIQHRDLKPSNIMVDGALAPKILDFGLSDSDPGRGHLRGTVHYIAPEQLDPSQHIDARTDVYALGVILYELLCGATPYQGQTTDDVLDAVRRAQPRLPVEINAAVPESLQAIALKAMERRPADRYQSAQEMAQDLDRYLDGRLVSAKPTQYATALSARVKPHLDQVSEWLRVKLIYPHEAARLTAAYRALDAREDDWIVASRTLSYSQIALYLGAFFLFAGSLFYFVAHRVEGAVTGLTGPVLILGVPFAGLNLAGRWLYRREHQAVAVAFYLGGLTLLPLFLLILLYERGLWVASAEAAHQLFTDGTVSNRQLQITIGLTGMWATWLALRTRTSALSTVSALLLFLFAIAIFSDFGLRHWLEDGHYDLVALHLALLVPLYGAAAWLLERSGRLWFARPAYIAGALTLIGALDLFALNGKLLHYAGVSMRAFQPPDVPVPALLDTLTGLALCGLVFYLAAAAIERRGSAAMTPAAQVLFTIAPFSMLEPLAYLSETAIYHERFDWLYLGLAIGIALLSHRRQRRSFYYAGLINAGVALYLIADRHGWFDRPAWAMTLVGVGLATLTLGFLLDHRRRRDPR